MNLRPPQSRNCASPWAEQKPTKTRTRIPLRNRTDCTAQARPRLRETDARPRLRLIAKCAAIAPRGTKNQRDRPIPAPQRIEHFSQPSHGVTSTVPRGRTARESRPTRLRLSGGRNPSFGFSSGAASLTPRWPTWSLRNQRHRPRASVRIPRFVDPLGQRGWLLTSIWSSISATPATRWQQLRQSCF